MRVILKNFRHHRDASFIFKNERLTLLKGPSGIGKSTIFQAIAWCLYSSMNNIISHNLPVSQKVSVTMETDLFTIYRQKRPELLRITYNDEDYLDDVAQGIIEQTYGNRDIWTTCSILKQGERNFLLTSSNKEKLSILQALSFLNENPRDYIDKIKTKHDSLMEEFKMKDFEVKKRIEVFEKKNIKEERTENIDKLLQREEEKLIELKKVEREQTLLRGKEEYIESSLKKLRKFTSEEISITREKIDSIRKEIDKVGLQLLKMKQYKKLVEAKEKYDKEVSELDKFSDVEELSYTNDDLVRVNRQLEEYKKNSQIATRLKIDYSDESIKDIKQELSNYLELNKYRSLVEKYKTGNLKDQREKVASWWHSWKLLGDTAAYIREHNHAKEAQRQLDEEEHKKKVRGSK